MKSVIIRNADQLDCNDVFDWRNDPMSKKMSHNSKHVSWDEHLAWFSDSLKDPSRALFICEDPSSNIKIGIVRFDLIDDSSTVSINLAPDMRGKGFSAICLTSSIDFFRKRFPHISVINATIKSSNIKSQKSFMRAGFAFKKKNGDTKLYALTNNSKNMT